MMNPFGVWIIRYSTGVMYAHRGFQEEAVEIAEKSVQGTDVTFVIV